MNPLFVVDVKSLLNKKLELLSQIHSQLIALQGDPSLMFLMLEMGCSPTNMPHSLLMTKKQ